MEPHAKLQVISIRKTFHKNFTSTNPVLKVNLYIEASPDLLVTCHCCRNGVVEIKCPYFVCEPVSSEENLDYLIKDVDKRSLFKLKKNHNYYAQIQGQMAIANCTHSWFFVYKFNGYHLEKLFFDKIYSRSILKKLTWIWYSQLGAYFLYNKDDKIDTISSKKVVI